jgi:hypothetical protein
MVVVEMRFHPYKRRLVCRKCMFTLEIMNKGVYVTLGCTNDRKISPSLFKNERIIVNTGRFRKTLTLP